MRAKTVKNSGYIANKITESLEAEKIKAATEELNFLQLSCGILFQLMGPSLILQQLFGIK